MSVSSRLRILVPRTNCRRRRILRWKPALLLGVLGLSILAGSALAARSVLRAVWGDCHSLECAYLPLPTAGGPLFVAAVYGLLIAVAVRQLSSSPTTPLGAVGTNSLSFLDRPAARVPWRWVVLLSALLLAAALRFGRLDVASFKHDEAVSGELAAAIIWEGHLRLVGILSSAEIPQLPGYLYLLAPVSALTRDPLALITFGIVLSLLTVCLCGMVAWRWFGPLVAITAMLFYAAGFWPVACGSRVWQQCLLPPFSLLFLDAVLLFAVARQSRALIAAAFWLGVMTHLHLLSATLLLVLPLAAWFGRGGLKLHHVLLSLLVLAGILSPYLVWELTPNVWFRDVRHFFGTRSSLDAQVDLLPLRYLAELASAGGAEQLLRPNEQALLARAEPWLRLAWVGAVLSALGLGWCIYKGLTNSNERASRLLLVACLLAPTVPLFRHSAPTYPHYLYVTLPLVAILTGIAVTTLWQLRERHTLRPNPLIILIPANVRRASILAALVLYAVGSMQVVGTLNGLLTEVENDEYGVPLMYTRQAALAAADAWDETGSSNPVFVGGHRTDVAPLVYQLSGAEPLHVQTFDDCKQLPQALPSGTAVVLLWDSQSPTAARLTSDEYLVESEQLLSRPGDAAFGLYVVEALALQGQTIEAVEATRFRGCGGRL